MKVLLDTHAFLWWIGNDPRLSQPARESIASSSNEVFFSVASAWEMSVKARLGKLKLQADFEQFLKEHLANSGFTVLPISFSHVLGLDRLPLLHRDPFDRMLISQSQCESMPLITADAQIRQYDAQVLW